MKHIIEVETAEPIRETMKPALQLYIEQAFCVTARCPTAITIHLNDAPSALQASHAELFKVLENIQRLLSQVATVFYDDKLQDHFPYGLADEVKAAFANDSLGIDMALANAAKLAPTRTGGSGCKR